MNMSSDIPYERLAFEPFGSLDGVLKGAPIKVFPVGTFYRDERKLTLTPERLKEFAANFKAGLPRFRVPINENHSGVGKVGTVQDIAYLADGPEGAGLYATQYELTDEGKKLISQKRFDAVSGEAIWTLNGDAKYQDPTTGKKHDNVLVGLALTDRPFFGHDNVALFSDHSDARYSSTRRGIAKMKELMASLMGLLEKDFMEDLPDHKRETASESLMQGEYIMTTPNSSTATNIAAPAIVPMVMPVAVSAETFTLKKEDFEALRAENEKAKIELAAVRTQADAFAAQLRETQRARRRDQLVEHCRTFVAVPFQATELAEKFQTLEEKDAELFTYFDGLVKTLDKALTEAELFGQKGSGRGGGLQAETYEALGARLLAEKFDGDPEKWGEAYDLARRQRPDLFNVYNETAYAPSKE
jgi:hypothetical protein